jgi:predicted enzyme related to lactoylglutathione lyase
MNCSMHHAHLFAADLDRAIAFYREFFGEEVALDMEMAGARNVFMKIGSGRIHFYDQPPKDDDRGPIHHLGIRTDDLETLVQKMKAGGVEFPKPISDFGIWKYVMASGPDGVLLELFQVDPGQLPEELKKYFL